MEIQLRLNKDFERCFEDLKEKYGEDFEYLNGLHPSQLDFSEFIDNFVDKDTLADASIDPNANANHKDIRSFMTEKGKAEDKLFGLNKIFLEIKKLGFKGSLTPFYDHYHYLSDGHHGYRAKRDVEDMQKAPSIEREPLLPIRQIAQIVDNLSFAAFCTNKS